MAYQTDPEEQRNRPRLNIPALSLSLAQMGQTPQSQPFYPTLPEETKQRVADKLAPLYEEAFSAYADYRPWRTSILANIERTCAMLSGATHRPFAMSVPRPAVACPCGFTAGRPDSSSGSGP